MPSWGGGGSSPPLFSAAGRRRRAAARAFAALLWPALCALERRLGRFREELIKQSPDAIDLYEASLETARLAQAPDEIPFVDYLRSLFAGRDLNLVVAMGAPAAGFVQRYRTEVFASTPLLITGADQRFVSTAALTWNDAAVATTLDLSKLIENVFQLLPDTRNIAFAIGNSPLERFWVDELRRASQAFAKRASFEWWNEFSLEEMARRAATRPQHSVIFYGGVRVDAHGVPHEEDRVFARLRGAANAPIFGYADVNFGHGIVGGPHLSTQDIGRQAAAVATRILNGEAPAGIKTPALGLQTPEYDWRELQRWNISESKLPPGSSVHFREATAWEYYRWQLAAVCIALAIQGIMITWLLLERHGRRSAEVDARNRLAEVIHLNRSAEAGALSASFAHELSQPLEAIMLSAATAERLLAPGARNGQGERVACRYLRRRQARRGHRPAFAKIGEAQERGRVAGIRPQQGHCQRRTHPYPRIRKRNVALRVNGKPQAFTVQADPIHLQQVILNLASNGMDAMANAPQGEHAITIQTSLVGDACVQVSVSNSGTGIPAHQLSEIFDTFYTTKPHGTGLGLSIARTIVESYGGKIWAENRPEGGAAFHFTLPLLG